MTKLAAFLTPAPSIQLCQYAVQMPTGLAKIKSRYNGETMVRGGFLLASLAVILLNISTAVVHAQQAQFLGCFVQENNQCADVELQCSNNSSDNYTAFDVAVGRLCDEVLLRNVSIADLQELVTETTQAISRLERSYSVVSRRAASLQRQKTRADTRITRLLRACGAPCRGM
jgi:cobalamin biosynthesis Mg chelatase CobN